MLLLAKHSALPGIHWLIRSCRTPCRRLWRYVSGLEEALFVDHSSGRWIWGRTRRVLL